MTEHNPHLRRTLVALLLGCALASGSTASASAAVLKADYGFNGTLASSVLPAPDLTQVSRTGPCATPNNFSTETVNHIADAVLLFDPGCGLQLDTSTLVSPGSYSFALLFRYSNVGFARIFDTSPGLLDHGLFVANATLFDILTADHPAPSPTFAPDAYTQIVFTRDGSTGEVVAYADGIELFRFLDTANDTLITAAQTPRFFIDNVGNDSGGAVSRVRVWDAPLTPAEVAALDDNVQSDVSIVATTDINPAYTGLPLIYSLAVSNTGPAAPGVVVTDPLPAGVDFVSASPGCTELNRVVTCALGTVGFTPVPVNVVVRPTAVNAALVNTATVSTTATDGDPANNSSTATTDVQPSADVSVAMTADVAQTTVGQALDYTVSVVNHGPGPAHSVAVTDDLSADVDLVSASPGCILSAGTVTCDFGTLAVGGAGSRHIVVRPNAPDPQLLNTATVQAITGDVNLDNNSATMFTDVHPPLGLPVVAAAPTTTPPGPSAPGAPPAAVVAPAAQAGTTSLGKPVLDATTRRGLLRSGLRFSQRVGGAGSLRWTLTRPASGSSKAIALGTATRTVTSAGTVRITLKLSRLGRRRLGSHTARLTLRTSFKPAGQSRHTIVTTAVRLRG